MANDHYDDTCDTIFRFTKDIEEENVAHHAYCRFSGFGSCSVWELRWTILVKKDLFMVEIRYWAVFIAITILWLLVRMICGIRRKGVLVSRELQLLMVYICIVVIVRIVYFPWHLVNGHIGTLNFDASKIIPFWINLIPVVRLLDIYDGWQMNVIGNIVMFIPVGIVWPICFKELDSIGKTVLAGAGLTFLIELSQLLFYERCSDIDDLILNTTGVLIGAMIYFGIRAYKQRSDF